MKLLTVTYIICCNFPFMYEYVTKSFLLCLMLLRTYHAQNYADIIGLGLFWAQAVLIQVL